MKSSYPVMNGPVAVTVDRNTPQDTVGALADASLCSDVLSVLRRRDQRRKGGMYVRGLLEALGRKTMRGLAAHAGEPAAEQSLHHFISSSTWDWEQMRARLARRLEQDLEPRAWVVRSMVVPKAGTHSVGVERRYVPHLGQAVNCQQSWGLWYAADHGSAPVNWQLSIGHDWLGDDDLRRRVAIPDEMPVSLSDTVAAEVAVQAASWGVTPRPVVMDAREVAPAPMMRALSAAGLPFLLRVSANTTLLAPALSGTSRVVTATAEHVAEMAPSQRRPVEWTDPADAAVTRTSLVSLLPVRWPRAALGRHAMARGSMADAGANRLRSTGLTLMAEWRPNRPRAAELWVTNVGSVGRGGLLRLGKLTRRVASDFRRVGQDVGLRDFEGRSYRGWHRHMTLGSLAHVMRLFDPRFSGVSAKSGSAGGAERAGVPVPDPVSAILAREAV